MKELLYSELYFASVEESNDPYDSKVFLSYDFDQPKWKRLIIAAWRNIVETDKLDFIINPLSEQISSDKPITFEEVMSYDYTSVLLRIDSKIDEMIALRLAEVLKYYIDLYRNANTYFTSFSKKDNSALMWSHYATRHAGFCLIFKAIDNSLSMSGAIKGGIRRDTPNGIGPTTSSPLPNKFMFEDIKYCETIEPIDASRFMPGYVSGGVTFTNESERIAFVETNIKKCLEKHKCWEYEEESRLVLREPTPWIYGQHNSLSKQERLFHYDFSQLVGIILGARMGSEERQRIVDIIRLKRESLWPQSKTIKRIFDFVVFEAKISDKARDVIINPLMIMAGSKDVNFGDEKFESLLNDWRSGKALVIDGNSGRSEYIQ